MEPGQGCDGKNERGRQVTQSSQESLTELAGWFKQEGVVLVLEDARPQ